MTVAEMSKAIGMRVSVRMESIQVTCLITDAKMSYGELRLKIQPTDGIGSQWISSARVTSANVSSKAVAR